MIVLMSTGFLFSLIAACGAVQPERLCAKGGPLPNVYCGRGGTACPVGYTCNIAPDDRYAVCCRDPIVSMCPRGRPLPGVFCGRGGVRCPRGHYCEIAPDDSYAVCCPLAGGNY